MSFRPCIATIRLQDSPFRPGKVEPYREADGIHCRQRFVQRFARGAEADKKGWGAKGDLDLGLIGRLAKEKP
jgi:hypothetical protein